MSGATPILPLYAFTAWTGTTPPLSNCPKSDYVALKPSTQPLIFRLNIYIFSLHIILKRLRNFSTKIVHKFLFPSYTVHIPQNLVLLIQRPKNPN